MTARIQLPAAQVPWLKDYNRNIEREIDRAGALADDSVTYAKIQNVSATDKLLGRSTAGAGDVEEIACTAAGRAILDDADAAAQRATLGLVIGTDVQAAGSYAAASHSHGTGDVTGLDTYVDERARDALGAALTEGAGITITPNDGADTITIARSAFRGALVKKAADQTAANYTASTNVAWDAETYDTDSIHDNSTNNTRLTVPSGVSKVRLSCVVSISAITADVWTQAIIWKNGSGAWDGIGKITVESGDTTPSVAAYSAVVPVSPGDYFEVNLTIETDTSVTIVASGSWFAMEIIE